MVVFLLVFEDQLIVLGFFNVLGFFMTKTNKKKNIIRT